MMTVITVQRRSREVTCRPASLLLGTHIRIIVYILTAGLTRGGFLAEPSAE